MTEHADLELETALRQCRFTTSKEFDARMAAAATTALSAEGTSSSEQSQCDSRGALRDFPAVNAERRGTVDRLPNSRHFGWPRRLSWLVASALMLATLVLGVRLFHPANSWAQVADAVRGRPWLLLKLEKPEKVEAWLSVARDVTAIRDPAGARFEDHRLAVNHRYVTREGTIYRTLASDKNPLGDLRSWEAFFQRLLRGDKSLKLPGDQLELIGHRSQLVERNGRKWQEFVVELRQRPWPAGQTATITLLVDPETHLPQFVIVEDKHHSNPPKLEFAVGFPDSGPVDIYDLDVPRDAKFVDRVPTNDVRRLVAAVKASAERFEPHVALNVMSDEGAPWYVGTPSVVFRDGNRWRMVEGLVDADLPAVEAPDADADPARWWRRRWGCLFYHPIEVSNGATSWSNEAVPLRWAESNHQRALHPRQWKRTEWPVPKWKRNEWAPVPHTSPLYIAYPAFEMARAGLITDDGTTVDEHPQDGPSDTIKLTLPSPPSDTENFQGRRFWIDPRRSYMVVRYEMLSRSPPLDLFHQIVTVDAAERSPGGIWYPTLMRHTHISEEGGKRTEMKAVTRHYLDFDVKFADDLFQPVARPAEPLD